MKWSKYIKPYLAFFILGPLCMIVEVVGEVIMPRLLAVVINGANKGTLTVPTSLGVMGLMILTALVMMGGGIGGAFFASKASVYFAADLREDCYRRIQQYSFANIDRLFPNTCSLSSENQQTTNESESMSSLSRKERRSVSGS